MLFNKIHEKWKPIIFNFYYNNIKIVELFEEILPTISFQPRKENIFKAFEMNPKKIDIVILREDFYHEENYLNNQRIFLLTTSLTSETNKKNSHKIYWNNFIKFIIKNISEVYTEDNKGIIWLLSDKIIEEYSYLIKNKIIIEEIYEGLPQNRNYILKEIDSTSLIYKNDKTLIDNSNYQKINNLLNYIKKQKLLK
jgi:uracil DNA glycosylase